MKTAVAGTVAGISATTDQTAKAAAVKAEANIKTLDGASMISIVWSSRSGLGWPFFTVICSGCCNENKGRYFERLWIS